MAGHSLHDDKGPTLLVLTCILTSLAIATTSLRCWVRWGNRQLGLDDGAMAVTTVLAVVRMSIQIVSVHYGNGKHREYVSDQDYKIVNKLTWATQVLLFPTICLMKVSICVLILRIKDTRTLRYILGAVITGTAGRVFPLGRVLEWNIRHSMLASQSTDLQHLPTSMLVCLRRSSRYTDTDIF
jgi:hypothetical protein